MIYLKLAIGLLSDYVITATTHIPVGVTYYDRLDCFLGKCFFHLIASKQRERGNPAVFSIVDTKDLTPSERSDPSPENLTFALLKSIFCPLPTVEE